MNVRFYISLYFVFATLVFGGAISAMTDIPKKTIKKSGFFEHVMGKSESDFKSELNDKEKCKKLYLNDESPHRIGKNRNYLYGNALPEDIKDLDEDINSTKIEKKGGGTFERIYPPAEVHIEALQADKENQGATFQVASNFHGLEGRCNPILAQKGDLKQSSTAPFFLENGLEEISIYAVQGEEAAISAAPGLIYKMYFDLPQNSLANFAPDITEDPPQIVIPVDQVGKINFSTGATLIGAQEDVIKKGWISSVPSLVNVLKDDKFISDFAKKVKVLSLSGVQVTSGKLVETSKYKNDSLHEIVDDPSQTIDQIFSAALDLDKIRAIQRGYDVDSPAIQVLAQLILYAMYEGVAKYAISKSKYATNENMKKVYITLLGSGSFKNKFEWIAEAIWRQRENIRDYGLKFYLVDFDPKAAGRCSDVNIDPILKLTKKMKDFLVEKPKAEIKQEPKKKPVAQVDLLASKLGTLKTSVNLVGKSLDDISKKLYGLRNKLGGSKIPAKAPEAKFEAEAPAAFTVSGDHTVLKFLKKEDFGFSPRKQFFKDLMGIPESTFMKDETEIKTRFFIEKDSDGKPVRYFIKGDKDRIYKCGYFQTIRLGDLRKQAEEKLKQNLAPIKFSVIEAGDWDQASLKNVDIGALQADPENVDAVFQVASNFNALETLSPTDNIDKGINNYPRDNTQGPRASISAAPGLIYRHYYYFYNDERKNWSYNLWRQRGQDATKNMDDYGYKLQLNLLEELGVDCQNGYVWDHGTIKNIREYDLTNDPNSFKLHSDYFRIGFHEGIQVAFGLTTKKDDDDDQSHFYNSEQVINQVFAAALNIAQDPVCLGTTNEQAKLILAWTYEATLKSALIKGKKKVFLTRIGGGAFGNKQKWIDKAIIDAVENLKNSGLEVVLNNFKFKEGYESTEVLSRLKDLVNDTGGSYVIYKKGAPVKQQCRKGALI